MIHLLRLQLWAGSWCNVVIMVDLEMILGLIGNLWWEMHVEWDAKESREGVLWLPCNRSGYLLLLSGEIPGLLLDWYLGGVVRCF